MTSDRPRMTPRPPGMAEDDGGPRPGQFSLAALMALVTIVSVTMALAVVHVGLLVPWSAVVLIGGGVGRAVAGTLRGWLLGMVCGFCAAFLLMTFFGFVCLALFSLTHEDDYNLLVLLALASIPLSGILGLVLGGRMGGILARRASEPADTDQGGEPADRESPPAPDLGSDRR